LVRAHDEGPIADARAIGARAGAALTEKQRGADPAALRGAP
jgi:hypothetical protein